jgi:phage shock protein C
VNRKRLYRCRVDRQIAGVAGGIAEYLDVDPTLVRILWIVSIFFGGVTILLYILMAFIVPLEPVGYGYPPASPGTAGRGRRSSTPTPTRRSGRTTRPLPWSCRTGTRAARAGDGS